MIRWANPGAHYFRLFVVRAPRRAAVVNHLKERGV